MVFENGNQYKNRIDYNHSRIGIRLYLNIIYENIFLKNEIKIINLDN